MTDRLLTRTEVAVLAGVSVRQLGYYLARGLLPGPDVAAQNHAPARWRKSRIAPALAKVEALPHGARTPDGRLMRKRAAKAAAARGGTP